MSIFTTNNKKDSSSPDLTSKIQMSGEELCLNFRYQIGFFRNVFNGVGVRICMFAYAY